MMTAGPIRICTIALALATAMTAAGCAASHHPAASSGRADPTVSSGPADPTASSGTASPAARSPSPARAIALAAAGARRIRSFTEVVDEQTTGHYRTDVAGTIKERWGPDPLVFIRYSLYRPPSGSAVRGGITEIIDNSTEYVHIDGLSPEPTKPWFSRRIRGIARSAPGLGILFLQAQVDSVRIQGLMLASSENVRKVTSATIGGVPATEYTGSFSVPAGVAELPPGLRTEIEQGIAGFGPETFKVWLDDRQQVRRLITSQRGSGDLWVSTIQVTGVNQPLNVRLPPASQVTPVAGTTTFLPNLG